MQGRKLLLLVTTAAIAGLSLAGCTVNHYSGGPAPQQKQQNSPSAQPVMPAQRREAAPQEARPVRQNAAVTPSTAPAKAPAPPVKPAPAPAAAGRSYTIKPGDNLWNISKQVYGDGTKYQRILDANPGLNPDNMKPGTTIVIP